MKMMQVIRKILLQTLHPRDLIPELRSQLALEAPDAVALGLDLLGERFLPLEWYLGEVQPLIKELGGDLPSYVRLAHDRFPEVYEQPQPPAPVSQEQQQDIFDRFSSLLVSPEGRAELLFRLTAWSSVVDAKMAEGGLAREAGEKLLAELESAATSIETRDLSPLEVQSMRRRLQRLQEAVPA